MDLEKFLSDMSFNASFRILEEGKDSDKLMEIAKSSGLVLPAHDLAVFECVYAFTDRQNKNGCTLPKTEVEKALTTLKGKSIDLDHNRKSVVGYWIEGRLVGDQILAYGAIWKGSFDQDFEIIKTLFDKKNLNVSFEAWGNRVANKTGYDLNDIEFAGGALLIKTEPAFDGASVLEMAKTRVLEMASTMTAPEHFVREKGTADESAYENFEGTDDEFEAFVIAEEEKIPFTFTTEDLENPIQASKLTTDQRKAIPNEHFAVVKTVKNKKTGGTRTIRKFPIADENHVRNALARLPQATESLSKLGVSPASVKSKILKRAKELNMKSIVQRHGGSTEEEKLEAARMYISDHHNILRNLQEVDCPNCSAPGLLDPTMIDYGNNSAKVSCGNCGSEMNVAMTPAVTLSKKGRKIKSIQDWKMKPGGDSKLDSILGFVQDAELSSERTELTVEDFLIPLPKLSTAARFELPDDDFAIVTTVEVEKGKNKKIRVLPIPDLAHIQLAWNILEGANAEGLLNKLSISKDSVDRKITRKVVNIAMKDLMKKYNKATAVEALQALAVEKIGRELTEAELEKAYSIVSLRAGKGSDKTNSTTTTGHSPISVTGLPKGKSTWSDQSIMDVTLSDNEYHELVEKASNTVSQKEKEDMEKAELQKKLDEVTAKLTEASAKLAEVTKVKEVEEAAKKAELAKTRRAELTEEFAKDLKDEDILDDTKFELAKLKKENAELKKGSKGGVKTVTVDLSKGSTKEGTTTTLTPEQASRKKIDDMAWASRNKPKSYQKEE